MKSCFPVFLPGGKFPEITSKTKPRNETPRLVVRGVTGGKGPNGRTEASIAVGIGGSASPIPFNLSQATPVVPLSLVKTHREPSSLELFMQEVRVLDFSQTDFNLENWPFDIYGYVKYWWGTHSLVLKQLSERSKALHCSRSSGAFGIWEGSKGRSTNSIELPDDFWQAIPHPHSAKTETPESLICDPKGDINN